MPGDIHRCLYPPRGLTHNRSHPKSVAAPVLPVVCFYQISPLPGNTAQKETHQDFSEAGVKGWLAMAQTTPTPTQTVWSDFTTLAIGGLAALLVTQPQGPGQLGEACRPAHPMLFGLPHNGGGERAGRGSSLQEGQPCHRSCPWTRPSFTAPL